MMDRTGSGIPNGVAHGAESKVRAKAAPPRGARVRRATRRRLGFDTMESRQLLATLAPIANQTIPATMSVPVVLDGGTNANPQRFTAASSNPAIRAEVLPGRLLEITVNHESSGPNDPEIDNETMRFRLFDSLTPLTIQRLEELINDGFYTNKLIHRIAANFPGPNDFIVQGGSVNGDGTGEVPRPGFPFQDEFVAGLGFTANGLIAMANAGRDTNSSQFFITTAQPRSLDYIHTIFGQLVDGQATLQKLTQIPRAANDRPTPNPVTITSVNIVPADVDGVLLIDGTAASPGQTATITVTATDTVNNTSTTRTFDVSVAANTQNQRPFFTDVPALTRVGAGQTAVIPTQIYNAEPTDTITYIVNGGRTGDPGNPTFTRIPADVGTATIDNNGVIRFVPAEGFTGTATLLVGVRDQVDRFGPGNRNFDLQQLRIEVGGDPVNIRPIASPTRAQTTLGTPIRLRLPGDAGNPGQTLVYSIVTPPANGTVAPLDPASGLFLYTPNPGFFGTDTFTYQVRDVGPPTPNLTSSPATVTIEVLAQGDSTVRLIPQPTADDEPTLRTLVVTPEPRPIGSRIGNTIRIMENDEGQIEVRINGIPQGPTPNASDLQRIVVYGSKANDQIIVDSNVSVPATLSGGQAGRNIIHAGDANSHLKGWFGQNVLRGGAGNDRLVGTAGRVRFQPSGGNDVYFVGTPGRGPRKPPSGQFFRVVDGRVTPIDPHGPVFKGSRHQANGNRRFPGAPIT